MKLLLRCKHIFFIFSLFAYSLTAFADTNGDFIVGVGTHLGQGAGKYKETIEIMDQANITSFRDEIPWSQIETVKGRLQFPASMKQIESAIDLARYKGIQPLLILDYGNKFYDKGGYPVSDEAQAAFVRYSEFIANYFKGRVRYYEVWNEWNSHGKPEHYARLLKKVYPAIKKIDPNAIVLGGSVEGAGSYSYLQALMNEDIVDSMDGLSIHPYVFWKGKQIGTPEFITSWIEKLQQYVLQKVSGGKIVPIYVTEIGWPTVNENIGVDQENAANYLARTYLMLRTLPYVKGVWWYNLRNDGDQANSASHNFGIVTSRFEPKPAYDAMKKIAPFVAKAKFIERVSTDKSVWMLRFRNPDSSEVLTAWRVHGEEPWRVKFIDADKDDDGFLVTNRLRSSVEANFKEAAKSVDRHSKQLILNDSPLIMKAKKSIAVKSAEKE